MTQLIKRLPVLLTVALVVALAGCEKKPAGSEESKAPAVSQMDSQVAPEPESAEPADPFADVDIGRYLKEQLAPPPPRPDRPPTFYEKLSRAALERTTHTVIYDGRYQKIAYPMGDVPPYLGVCTDLVVRSYRTLGIDLQELVHRDMRKAFGRYPSRNKWGLVSPDTNIDHRRVPNLRVFFERNGESLPVSEEAMAYQPGDIVTWKLNEKMTHIGIVSEQVSMEDPQRYLIIHNIGEGPELSDMLFDFEITGHYRYPAESGAGQRIAQKGR